MTIAILDYGMGNLHSVARAVERVGGDAEVTGDPEIAAAAQALVVPGVGRFGACMRNLIRRGLDRPIRDAAAGGRPIFGVCLGMQILFERSEEDPDPGLGILPGGSRRLTSGRAGNVAAGEIDGRKIPHMGWNDVAWIDPHPYVAGLPAGTRFYFVHTFAPDVIEGITVGVCEYGRPFSAIVARDNVFATQFHPEKSGEAGLAIYEAFVKEASSS